MATIGSVLISVYAKTEGLRKSLKKAEKTISVFAKKAAKTLKTASISIGVGVAAGVAAVIATVNKYATEIDKLAKTSSKLGITVKSLQKLQYQAELTGLGAEKFNKAFNKMVTVIADADNGLSTAKRSFDKLGLSVDHIKSLSADQQFYAIAESLKGINNQTEKLGLMKDIFGAGATGILNTLNSNLRETSAEFDALGISITQSGARMVEAYQDSKTKLGAIFSGFGIQLTAQLAAPFTKLNKWVVSSIKKMGGMDVAAKKFAKFVITGIKSSISAVQLLIKSFVKLENLMLRIENIKLLPAIAAEALASQVAGTPGVVGVKTQQAFDNQSQIDKNNAELKNNSTITALDKLLKSLDKSIGKGVESAAGKASQTYTNSATSVQKLAEAADKAASAIAPKTKLKNNVIDFGDMSARIKAQDIFSGAGGFSGFGKGLSKAESSSGKVRSIQEHIDASQAGKALQEMRKGKFGRNSGIGMSSAGLIPDYAEANGKMFSGDSLDKLLNGKATTKITLEMITDNGKVAGELIGNQDFINAIGRLQNKNINKEARAATI